MLLFAAEKTDAGSDQITFKMSYTWEVMKPELIRSSGSKKPNASGCFNSKKSSVLTEF